MAPHMKYDPATLQDTLDEWAAGIPDGGSFSAATYDRWYGSQSEPRPPSQATIAKYLAPGRGWGQAVLARRTAIAGVAPGRSIEVPVTCRARRPPRWVRRPLSDWAGDPSCGCARCQEEPSIAEAYPHLVRFLDHAEDAELATSVWVRWVCPVGGRSHRLFDRASPGWIAQGNAYCPDCRGRPFPTVGPTPQARPEPGSVVSSNNPVTSVLEQQVRDVIAGAGYQIAEQKLAVWCRHQTIPGDLVAITPDILLPDHHIAVEVDPCPPLTSHRGFTHRGKEPEDRLRNEFLAAVGWTVLRLRLAAEEGAHIGDRDVVCESSTLTAKAAEALLAALDDLVCDRDPLVRFVPKGPTPRKPATRRSTVVRIGSYAYGDQAHIFTWYPNRDTDDKVYLRLAMDGRYLYTHGKQPLFISEVGLHDVPPEQWRQRLQDILVAHAPLGGEALKYPWGNHLLLAEREGPDTEQVVDDCERHATIDEATVHFTTNCDAVASSNPTALLAEDETVLVRLHPNAVKLGYRFINVRTKNGYRGPYLDVTLTRWPE